QRFVLLDDLARMSDVLFRGPIDPRHADEMDLRLHHAWRTLRHQIPDLADFAQSTRDVRISAAKMAMMLETGRPTDLLPDALELPDARTLSCLLSLRCEKDDAEELNELYRLLCQKLQGCSCSHCHRGFDESSSCGIFDGEQLTIPVTVPKVLVPPCGHALHTLCIGEQIIPNDSAESRGLCRQCGQPYGWTGIDVDPMVNAFCLMFGPYVDTRSQEMYAEKKLSTTAILSISEASVFEKDLVFNYEVIKEVMMSIHGALPLVLPQGIPPLKDFEAAFVYTTAAHNLHVELHQLQGGKKRMRDWAHKEATRLRAALQHLHRLTAKMGVSRNPMVEVLKKLYVHFRSMGSDVGDLGHDALEDIDNNDQGEELVIENLDDEPIIISARDRPSPGGGMAMKAIRDCTGWRLSRTSRTSLKWSLRGLRPRRTSRASLKWSLRELRPRRRSRASRMKWSPRGLRTSRAGLKWPLRWLRPRRTPRASLEWPSRWLRPWRTSRASLQWPLRWLRLWNSSRLWRGMWSWWRRASTLIQLRRPRLWRRARSLLRPVLETLRLKLCAFTFCMCDSTGHYKALFVALDSTFPLTHCPHRTPVWTPAACLLRNELHRWHSMKRCQWPLPLQAAGRADGRLLRSEHGCLHPAGRNVPDKGGAWVAVKAKVSLINHRFAAGWHVEDFVGRLVTSFCTTQCRGVEQGGLQAWYTGLLGF
ncbi:Hypothetical protein SCF082_LOCUS34695, partial [Durusdinium trenchii]